MIRLVCRGAVAAAWVVSLPGQLATAAQERPGDVPSVEMPSPASASQQPQGGADEAVVSIEGRAAFASMRDQDPELNGFVREASPTQDGSK